MFQYRFDLMFIHFLQEEMLALESAGTAALFIQYMFIHFSVYSLYVYYFLCLFIVCFFPPTGRDARVGECGHGGAITAPGR